MSERESDIEFDFFEESDTQERAEERPRRRGPRPPVRPPTGLTPLLRLIGLISFAILIVLLLVVWVNGCREDQRNDTYKNYVEKVGDYGTQSEQIGKQLTTLLTQRGTKAEDVQSELSGLAQRQDQLTSQARDLDPPGHLRDQHEHVIDALELRTSGLNGMAGTFQRTAGTNRSAQLLVQQMQRFVASDVVWADLYQAPTKNVLRQLGITGVDVPASNFISNPDLVSTASMKAVWQRIHESAAGSGGSCSPRGTGIVSTKVLPAGNDLSTSELNTINLSTDLAFSVTVENSGCAQEVDVKVRMTIQQANPITKQATIDLINQGDQKTVTFRDIGQPSLDQKTTLTVEVEPVPGETKKDNNTATYSVQFSVG